jgi:uncharacterized membrane protein
VLVSAIAVAYLAISGDSLASSSHAVLHGLCAQRPTHSFGIGGVMLPFDARMTGIYLGALGAWIVLATRGRLLAAATPPRAVLAVLALAVVALAVDGFNAMFVDLGTWHPYPPKNQVRFLTGFGTGVAIVSLEAWLLGGTFWKIGKRLPTWRNLGELSWCVPVSLMLLGIVMLDVGWTYPVFVTALLLSAWLTVMGLVLVIVVSLLRLERRVDSPRALDWPLVGSALLAIGVIVGLAQFRYWLERALGIPEDLMAMSVGSVPSILEGLLGWPPLGGIV